MRFWSRRLNTCSDVNTYGDLILWLLLAFIFGLACGTLMFS